MQGNNKAPPIILVGTKNDLISEVPTDLVIDFTQRKNIMYYETSAKTGQGVNDAIL